ncbi:MAG: CotH kinase family protein [Bacteroidaceae bacterium]|nr:CotH kinase family protein [Bacteroidaceae bacterium]
MSQRIFGSATWRTVWLAGLLALCASGVHSQPRFGRAHGLFRSKFMMKITKSDSQAEVRYTTDGSEPTASSTLYSSMLSIDRTLVLRAAEFKDGVRTSDITTASYIFPLDVLQQPNNPEGYPSTWGSYTSISGTAIADYEMDPEMTSDSRLANRITQGLYSLPVLSIVTDRGNLFSKTKSATTGGIYIFTGTSDSNGRGWERPASIELFGGEEAHDLTSTCALKLHGGQGRVPEKNPKHSFRLVFKSEYGPSKLEYPIYGQRGVEEYNSLIVRTFYNYSWLHTDETQRTRAQYTRDLWARRMQFLMGHPSSDGIYVHVFLNGLYWGMYNLTERIDDSYGKYHFGGRKEDYDIVKREDALETTDGTLDRWREMVALSEKAADNRYYQMLIGQLPVSDDRGPDQFLDAENLIDYMLINQYMGNLDWDHHNWIAFCNRKHATQGFRFICWDSENTLSNPSTNVLSVNNRDCPTYIFNNLMKNREFQRLYIDHAYRHLSPGGLLSEEPAQALWDSLYNVLSLALYDEAARWGDYRRDVHPYSSKGKLYMVDDQYAAERSRMLKDFFPSRTTTLIKTLRAKGWYSDITPPSFLVNGETPAGDTLRWDDALTLSGGSFILYTSDGSNPVTWLISSSGSKTASASTYLGENLLDAFAGHEGWVTFRAILKSGSDWSPTVQRRFYLTSGTGVEMAQGFENPRVQGIYDLSGHKIANGPSSMVNG